MDAFRRWRQALFAAMLLALTTTAWVLFAPQQVGGNAAYVIILGNSMEPAFHRGDLVIVRRASSYQVGDVVAYTDPQLQRYLFHRIIARQGERFLLQGDHNDWVDSYRPRAEEIIGKEWIHLPGFGRAVQQLRQPLTLGILTGLVAGALAALFLLARPRARKRVASGAFANGIPMENLITSVQELRAWLKKRLSSPQPPKIRLRSEPPRADRRGQGILLEALFFVFGLLAFLSLALGVFAFTRPLTRLAPDDIAYQHSGVFAYTATAPPGVYDAPEVTPGQPIFHKLTCLLTLNFDYALLAQGIQHVQGTYRLAARVREERSGWERRILLQPATPFDGRTYSAKNMVNLCSTVALVERFQEQTEYRSTYYTFVLEPQVTIRGELAGRALEDSFAPRLTFRFDSTLFYLYREDEETNPLLVSQKGVLSGQKAEPNTMALLGNKFPVVSLRWVSAIGLLVALSALGALAFFIAALTRRGPNELAQVKYGAIMVEIESNAEPPAAPLTEVASIDDLARLAERHGTTILHQPRSPLHYYYVHGTGMVYRYALSESPGGALGASLARLRSDLHRALEQQEFRVYYQPILSLPDRRIVGVEALLRWQHPEHGLVAPGEFLEAAEATGLIEPIGEWLLQTAGAQCLAWEQAGLSLWLTINLSIRQLSPAPAQRLRRWLRTCGLLSERLRVEIMERKVIEREEEILSCLQGLGEDGVHIALDDFSGRVSMLALERLPVRSVKLDRLLVACSSEPEWAALLQRIIRMAQGLGMDVIAEGIEDEKQMVFLLSNHCLLGQGYLFARPLPAEQLTPMLTAKTVPAFPEQKGRRKS